MAYSYIAIQSLYLATQFPTIYWDCAVLCVNAGTIQETIEEDVYDLTDEDEIEEKEKKAQNVNYGKIAKAIGMITQYGIEIAPPNINEAQKEFEPDVAHNRILYSLKALSGVGDKEIEIIYSTRPYSSFADFLERAKVKKPTVISLIKSGAFDELEGKSRYHIMEDYISIISEPKQKLNMQNFQGLMREDLIPEEMEFYAALYRFNKYLKPFKLNGKIYFDERAYNFISKYVDETKDKLGYDEHNGVGYPTIDEKVWKKIYDKKMLPMKNYIIEHQEELLNNYNKKLFDACWDKYAAGTISKWEMDSMSFYWHEHELQDVKNSEYGIEEFEDLPEEPEIERIYTIKGRDIPIYKLTTIVGTCIDKNNIKGTFTLLTAGGSVVNVRLGTEVFAIYNKQISEIGEDGKKKVKEKSWFKKGNKLMVLGYRRDDQFVPKKYKNTIGHRLSLIKEVTANGDLIYTNTRYGEGE